MLLSPLRHPLYNAISLLALLTPLLDLLITCPLVHSSFWPRPRSFLLLSCAARRPHILVEPCPVPSLSPSSLALSMFMFMICVCTSLIGPNHPVFLVFRVLSHRRCCRCNWPGLQVGLRLLARLRSTPSSSLPSSRFTIQLTSPRVTSYDPCPPCPCPRPPSAPLAPHQPTHPPKGPTFLVIGTTPHTTRHTPHAEK